MGPGPSKTKFAGHKQYYVFIVFCNLLQGITIRFMRGSSGGFWFAGVVLSTWPLGLKFL